MSNDDRYVTTDVQTEDTDERTRVTTITAKHFPPDATWWTDQDKVAKLEQTSEAAWQKLDNEERQALIVLVTDCLHRMSEDPNVWIPTSMVPQTGHKLDLWVCINLDEVDQEVVRRRVEAEQQLHATRNDLIALDKELGELPGNDTRSGNDRNS